MTTPARLLRLLPAIALLAVALATALLPARPAGAQTVVPDWSAWNLKVTFPNNTPRAIYTFYSGTAGDPIEILSWNQRDLTPYCTFSGLTYDADGYARFNGTSSEIVCPLPPKMQLNSCDSGAFWVAADLKLKAANANNPIFEGIEGGSPVFNLSVPVNAGKALARLNWNAVSTSPKWNVIQGAPAQIMFATNGPAAVDVTDHFNGTEGFDWLTFMGGWQGAFDPEVTAQEMGFLRQPAGAFSQGPHGPLWEHPEFVVIGHSPANGTFFNGSIKALEIDPPGCRGE